MTQPSLQQIYAVMEATWPAASATRLGPWTIRDGQGGGNRVGATTAEGPYTPDDFGVAEDAMTALGQEKLFMIRQGEDRLDEDLEARGYRVRDAVVLYSTPVTALTTKRPPPITTFEVWPPVAVQEQLWANGGIGPARIDVMMRGVDPKHSILGRVGNRSAGTAYVGMFEGIGMFHALEVGKDFRRQGLARHMVTAMAHWVRDQGGTHLALIVTRANAGANALYASMGFALVGDYHYRVKLD